MTPRPPPLPPEAAVEADDSEPILIGHISRGTNYVEVKVGSRKAKALVDSRNSYGSCISQQFFEELGFRPCDLDPLPSKVTVATARKGTTLEVSGQLNKPVHFYLGDYPKPFTFKPYVIPGLGMPMNLSKGFLTDNKIDELHSSNVLQYQGSHIAMGTPAVGRDMAYIAEQLDNADIAIAYIAKDIEIPCGGTAVIPLDVPKWNNGCIKNTALFEADPSFYIRTGCLPERNGEIAASMEGQFSGQIMNISNYPVKLTKGMRYGDVTYVDPVAINSLYELCALALPSEEETREKIRTGFKLLEDTCVLKTPEERKRAEDLLWEFRDVFSWDGSYGKTHLIKHYIPLKKGTRPIASKVRPMNPILESNFKAQLDEWIRHGIVKPSKSEWNSTVVPVPKKAQPGKAPEVRYCLDFR